MLHRDPFISPTEICCRLGFPGKDTRTGSLAIYIAEIHGAVEAQVEDSQGIAFVDDVTWLVERTDLNDMIDKLERCAAAIL